MCLVVCLFVFNVIGDWVDVGYCVWFDYWVDYLCSLVWFDCVVCMLLVGGSDLLFEVGFGQGLILFVWYLLVDGVYVVVVLFIFGYLVVVGDEVVVMVCVYVQFWCYGVGVVWNVFFVGECCCVLLLIYLYQWCCYWVECLGMVVLLKVVVVLFMQVVVQLWYEMVLVFGDVLVLLLFIFCVEWFGCVQVGLVDNFFDFGGDFLVVI